MALVNPNIAMSFRQPEFTPRNALAEYAQIQQIQGGQRQAEMADMQMEALRRDRDALSQIQAAIVAKGGPPDLAAAADAMIKSGKPEYLTQGMAIRQKLADQTAFANYQKEFGPAAQNALGASPTGMDLPAGNQPATEGLTGRVPGVVTTPVPVSPPMNAMVPAPAAPVNAMMAQPDIASLEARYRRVANLETPGAKAEAALLLKQIDRAATATPADIRTMQALGYPITQAGFAAFRDAQRPERLLTPEEEAQQLRLRLASRPPGVNITNVGEKAEAGEFGKLLVRGFEDVSNAAKVATRTLPSLDANLAILDKGFTTGFGTEAQTAAASVLAALGVEKAKDFATNSQTFLANASSAVLQRQLEQKGPQTEADAQRITQTGAQLGNTPQANRFLIDVAREQLKRDIEQRNFYANWQERNGSFKGAENAWFAGDGGKSLFERPNLKKYTAPAGASSDSGRPSLESIFKGKKP